MASVALNDLERALVKRVQSHIDIALGVAAELKHKPGLKSHVETAIHNLEMAKTHVEGLSS